MAANEDRSAQAADGASDSQEQGPDFERALEELETLVQRMEKGDLTLEESLAQFERGIALTRACQQALSEAQQKVDVLVGRENGEVATAPFRQDD